MVCRTGLLRQDEEAVALWLRDKAPHCPAHIQVLKRYQYFTQAMA